MENNQERPNHLPFPQQIFRNLLVSVMVPHHVLTSPQSSVLLLHPHMTKVLAFDSQPGMDHLC